MDKMRMRLVRSQSMGVGMGSGGSGIHGSHTTLARQPIQATQNFAPETGRNASIVLLDERRLEMLIRPRLEAGELLDLVANHCQLKEKEYFGLAVVDDNGQYTWLQLDRKVLDHDLPRKPTTLTIHFFVKFFIESMAQLAENRTVELFYQQARSLIFKGSLEVDSDIVFQLAALSLQAAQGDFADAATTRNLVKKCPVLPASILKEHSSLTHCEDQVIEHYQKTKGQTRGQAIVNYMTIVESMPTYGVHYFEVLDKKQNPWWLGLSCKGIAQYNFNDRKTPIRVFQWKQLENLYFRDKKFSIEVHDKPSVVQTLSSFNLYEDALKLDAEAQKDGLVDAIADSTTQVSVSKRTFNPGSIHVYVWFGKTQSLTKCIWQSAISQHQFYLDQKQAKMRHVPHRSLKEIARDLTRSSASLSSTSSVSNLSRSGSAHSLATLAVNLPHAVDSCDNESEQNEEMRRARIEMLAALKARKDALESKLKEKRRLLKELCIKEGELTGELPPEIPLDPGEPAPIIRKRIGTEFALSEALIQRTQSSPEEELLAKLELEREIQSKITSAALKIANDSSAAKSVRKQRKLSYQQNLKKLQDIEARLSNLKHLQSKQRRKLPRADQQEKNAQLRNLDVSTVRQDGIHIFQQPLPIHNLIHNSSRQSRRGASGLDSGHSIMNTKNSQISIHVESEQESQSNMSPKSAPASPRKSNQTNTNDVFGLLHQKHSDSISLESSPQRMPRVVSGYVPNSLYLRSSYRSKQYPTLTTPTGIVRGPSEFSPIVNTASVKTLPSSPYRNKYEVPNIQTNSPVGLYNIPQQRTSQAFSSMDDLDGMASVAKQTSETSSPTQNYFLNHRQIIGQAQEVISRAEAATQHASRAAIAKVPYPSLERSTSRSRRRIVMGSVTNSVSMEDLEALEASGVHGKSKMSYREVVHANAEVFNAGQSKMMLSNNHRLQNNEAYPPHSHAKHSSREIVAGIYHQGLVAAAAAARAVMEEGGGSYPFPSVRSSTLLPGQTYPDPLPAKLSTTMQPITNLDEVLMHHNLRVSTANLATAGGDIRTSGSNNSTSPGVLAVSTTADSESPPPPLFPKQYHQVVEQRRRSGLDRPTAIAVPIVESPVVDRKIKPGITKTSSCSVLNFSDLSPGPPIPPPTSTIPSRPGLSPSASNCSTLKYVPYRETTKPFEMSDFYKYSTKYRKTSASRSEHSESSGSSIDSPSSSSGSSQHPPELPARPANSQSPAKGSLPPPPPPIPPPPPLIKKVLMESDQTNGNDSDSLGDAFSSEMLAWFNSQQKQKGQSNNNVLNGTTTNGSVMNSNNSNSSNKPATLV